MHSYGKTKRQCDGQDVSLQGGIGVLEEPIRFYVCCGVANFDNTKMA